MTAAMAAPAVFDRRRNEKARRRDIDTHWYGAASVLLRALRAEGHVRVVSPEGSKPYVYEWVEP